MTLQNSMDERKLKNYQAFDLTLLSSMSVCICVCVCVCRAGRVCVCVCVCVCVWIGMEGAVFSVWQWGGLREGGREGGRLVNISLITRKKNYQSFLVVVGVFLHGIKQSEQGFFALQSMFIQI